MEVLPKEQGVPAVEDSSAGKRSPHYFWLRKPLRIMAEKDRDFLESQVILLKALCLDSFRLTCSEL